MSVDVDEVVSIEYETDSTVNEVLAEIQENSGVDLKNTSSNSLLKSYSINEEDLTIYASDNSYESGKKDPFAESSETIEEHTTTTVQTGTATQTQTSNPIKNTNTVSNQTSTVTTNSNKNTNTVSKNNTVSNTTVNKTNTVTNSVSNNKTNNVNTISKDKNESSITTGTFFENKNSK